MMWSFITERGFKKFTQVLGPIHYCQMLTEEMFEVTISIDWDNYCSIIFSMDDDNNYTYFFHDSSRTF